MTVDDTRQHQRTRSVNCSGCRFAARADGKDFAIFDSNISNGINIVVPIDDTAATDNTIQHVYFSEAMNITVRESSNRRCFFFAQIPKPASFYELVNYLTNIIFE